VLVRESISEAWVTMLKWSWQSRADYINFLTLFLTAYKQKRLTIKGGYQSSKYGIYTFMQDRVAAIENIVYRKITPLLYISNNIFY